MGDPNQHRDRRSSPRVLLDLEVDYGSEETFLFAYIRDMSALGIFVRTNNPEPQGTELNLRFTLPGERAPLAVEGRVVWVNPFRPGDVNNLNPGMGVKFVHLDEVARKKIRRLVRTIAYLEGEAAGGDEDIDDVPVPTTPSTLN
ncbi:MAG: TIGR02266 family protein [Deltaproteobacteria bacterium]|nr:TIGR02266 family protein [Deltaproteobacteria bacterium]